jgi:hypothetical protein
MKASETLKSKLNLFIKITKNLDEYVKTEKDFDRDFNVDKPIKDITTDIVNSKVKNFVLKGSCNTITEETLLSLQEQTKYKTEYKKLFLDLNNRENAFVIMKADVIDLFNQCSNKNNGKYFSKVNEFELIKTNFITKFKKKINRLFLHTLQEKERNFKIISKIKNKDNLQSKILNSSLSKSKILNYSRGNSPKKHTIDAPINSLSISSLKSVQVTNTNEEEVTKNPRNHSQNYINKFLYQESKKKEDLLKTNFVVSKIYEYKFHGNLNKKYNIDEYIQTMKIKKEKPNFNVNIKRNIEILDDIVCKRKIQNEIKEIDNIVSFGKSRYTANTKQEENNVNDILQDTNSNYYIKINRNLLDINLSKFKIYC